MCSVHSTPRGKPWVKSVPELPMDALHGGKLRSFAQSWVAQDITRIAPHLMPFEVANALHRRVLRGELNVGDSTRMISRLLESRLELHLPPGLHVRALQLASQLKQEVSSQLFGNKVLIGCYYTIRPWCARPCSGRLCRRTLGMSVLASASLWMPSAVECWPATLLERLVHSLYELYP